MIADTLNTSAASTLDLSTGITSVGGHLTISAPTTVIPGTSILVMAPTDATNNVTTNGHSLNNFVLSSNDGLVGYWKLDETTIGGANSIIDSSGNTNHGTPNDIAGPEGPSTNLAPVNFTNARSWDFDGDGDYINLGDSANFLPVNTTNPFAISAWVRWHATVYDRGRAAVRTAQGRSVGLRNANVSNDGEFQFNIGQASLAL